MRVWQPSPREAFSACTRLLALLRPVEVREEEGARRQCLSDFRAGVIIGSFRRPPHQD